MATFERAIEKGIRFLETTLSDDGFFQSYAAEDPGFSLKVRDNFGNFVNALIILNLRAVGTPAAEELIKKAEAALLNELITPGFWRYSPRKDNDRFPPDLDDTCVISEILKEKVFELILQANVPVILEQRNEEGLFRTWVSPPSDLLSDHIDPIVNINVVGYLGEIPETEQAVTWIIKLLNDKKELTTHNYYTSPGAFYYFFTLTALNKSARFRAKLPVIAERASRLLEEQPGLNALDRSLLVTTLIRSGSGMTELVEQNIERLLAEQRDDGAWPCAALYDAGFEDRKFAVYYGGETIVTGMALEAIALFHTL